MPLVRDNTRGILLMNVAMLGFTVSDAFTKLSTRSLPLGETIFLRGLIAATLIGLAVIHEGSWREWRRLVDPRIVLRLIGELGATLCYLIALVHVPLPNVTAVFQATPLTMTVAAALFLGERIGVRRWAAIAVGFCGVMVIVRPGLDGFDPMSLLVLASVVCVVLRDIATARLSATIPTPLVTLATAVAVTAMGPLLIPFESAVSLQPLWRVPNPGEIATLFLASSGLLIGYVFLIRATRLAETSAIAPFRYVLLVWAFVFGLTLFGDYPDLPTVIGAAVVVATGLYSIDSERRARLAAA
ncbi:DMT family transporter [Siculibacillus lacustris]|uniref:DMT family transporter n=1 Tax=Siculibacillus lacustris TaxID=1549641 RepID=A0A4Q9VY65_9HYPH|nr:DMT family transporter [Siculibacillus lacustris]TBW40922.1 DMT family transporter [Siculibacillus lacustris]